jgi:hypothetical protein
VEPTKVVEVSTSVWPGAGVLNDACAGGAQGARIWLVLRVDRRRHAHDHRIGGRDGGWDRAEPQALAGERLAQACDVPDWQVDVAGADSLQPLLADVDPDRLGTGAVQRQQGRQADVAQPDHGDAWLARACERGRQGRGGGRDWHDVGCDRERLRFGHGGSSRDRDRARARAPDPGLEGPGAGAQESPRAPIAQSARGRRRIRRSHRFEERRGAAGDLTRHVATSSLRIGAMRTRPTRPFSESRRAGSWSSSGAHGRRGASHPQQLLLGGKR